MGIPDHLTRVLRNLDVGQEVTVRSLYGTTDWFKIEKEVRQGCLLSACLCNQYTEQIMRNAEIKIHGRNISNLRYHSNAESEEELMSFLVRVKEDSESASLRLDI